MKFLVFSLATLLVSAALGSAQEAAFDVKASAERRKPLYLQTCIACHQPTGMGLPAHSLRLAERNTPMEVHAGWLR